MGDFCVLWYNSLESHCKATHFVAIRLSKGECHEVVGTSALYRFSSRLATYYLLSR